MGKGLKPILVINKIDRSDARVEQVLEQTQDLFLELATRDDQLDFPILYAAGREGWASTDAVTTGSSMEPLFETILKFVPPPVIEEGPFQMLVSNLDYDNHKGKLCIGRIWRGKVSAHDQIVRIVPPVIATQYEVKEVATFFGLKSNEVESAQAGDIVTIAGIEQASIGDTIASPEKAEALPRITIGEPTVEMNFCVNTSPFAGKEGQYCTTRQLRARLYRELETNLSLRVQDGETTDVFRVCGRGELHLSILIETMRREGYELAVSKPEAIVKEINGTLMEPVEDLVIDTRENYIGVITEMLSKRRAKLTNMHNDGQGSVRMEYRLPTRGLIGFRSDFLTATRGEGIMNTQFLGYEPLQGEIGQVRSGVLVSAESGMAVTYGLNNAQGRGLTFIEPQTPVYEGMIVGVTPKMQDISSKRLQGKEINEYPVFHIRYRDKTDTSDEDEPGAMHRFHR